MITRLFMLQFIVVAAFGSVVAVAQDGSFSEKPSTYRVSVSKSLHEQRVIVFRQDADPLVGFLHGIVGDTLIIQCGVRQEKLGSNELTTVVVIDEPKRQKIATYGMLVGVYLGNLAFYKAEGQPTAYYSADEVDDNTLTHILLNALFVCAGGGLGYLFGIHSGRDKTFRFTGSEQDRRVIFERFFEFVEKKSRGKSLHFSVQGGHVFTRTVNQSKHVLENAGVEPYASGGFYYRDGFETPSFDLLRKMELTYSLSPKVEVGVAALWIGEPLLSGHKSQWSIKQSYNASAYYAIGKYVLHRSTSPLRRLQSSIGGGIGVAEVDFNLVAWRSSYTEGRITIYRRLDKTPISAYVYCELDYFILESLSFGLYADYVLTRSYSLPGIQEIDIDAQKVRVGNASIGFALGLHL